MNYDELRDAYKHVVATREQAIKEVIRLEAENNTLRTHLEAIRDYVDNPSAVSAKGMTAEERLYGMWSQAVAALAQRGEG